jgi:hypothetical protein
MYVKTTSRTNKDGTAVRYVHLAHNEWDPVAGRSVPKVLYSFGREDALDRAAVRRLVASLSKLLDPADVLAATAGSDLVFLESRPFGGAFVLDALWRRLGIDKVITALDPGPRRGRPRDAAATERVLFGLVANRALAPSSKLAAAEWISNDVHIENLPGIGEQACYRAMDWLHDARASLEAGVFDTVATVLNLEVDLLFFDTTSTYFELGEPDEPVARDGKGHRLPDGRHEGEEAEKSGFRTHGKSKDSRDDLPQIVIGMAVTRDGIPVRCWCWPGNASDQVVIRQVKDEMRDWTLSKIVWVTDRGFSSAENRRYLRSGDHHYIIGEKLRSGSAEVKAALSRQGRYTDIAGNMRIKEVRISDHERFLRVTPAGLLRTDKATIKTETNLDGKYLLRCSDPHLPAEDIALGYKQLLEVERGWRDMKQIIDLRPVYHRLEERIRAHVILCWLALLLIRIIEATTGDTWNNIRRHLDRLHVGTFTGPAGTFRQRTELTKPQRDLLAKLAITPPKQIVELEPA